jgi:hypothetical protein
MARYWSDCIHFNVKGVIMIDSSNPDGQGAPSEMSKHSHCGETRSTEPSVLLSSTPVFLIRTREDNGGRTGAGHSAMGWGSCGSAIVRGVREVPGRASERSDDVNVSVCCAEIRKDVQLLTSYTEPSAC